MTAKQPAPVDLEKLKRSVCPINKWVGNPDSNRFDIGWNDCIDHLHERGLLALK